jgi:hypothetical protein
MLESMILIPLLVAARPTERATKDIYEQRSPIGLLVDGWNPTAASHTEMLLARNYPASFIRLDIPKFSTSEEDAVLRGAFEEIALPQSVWRPLLGKAKEALASASFTPIKIVPVLAKDMEEDQSLLTIRLYVDADFEKAMELDLFLTKSMVAFFPELPEQLSFTVYESDDLAT